MIFGKRKRIGERLEALEKRIKDLEAEQALVLKTLRSTKDRMELTDKCLMLIGDIFAEGDKRIQNVELSVDLLRGLLEEADKERSGKKTVSDTTTEKKAVTFDKILDEWVNGEEGKEDG